MKDHLDTWKLLKIWIVHMEWPVASPTSSMAQLLQHWPPATQSPLKSRKRHSWNLPSVNFIQAKNNNWHLKPWSTWISSQKLFLACIKISKMDTCLLFCLQSRPKIPTIFTMIWNPKDDEKTNQRYQRSSWHLEASTSDDLWRLSILQWRGFNIICHLPHNPQRYFGKGIPETYHDWNSSRPKTNNWHLKPLSAWISSQVPCYIFYRHQDNMSFKMPKLDQGPPLSLQFNPAMFMMV